jgi:YidC/Oxa1 family membrane protein insertase
MNGIYAFFNLFGIENLALTIIVFTFITKMLMLPLTIKQQKFSRLSSRMNPEVQKIQAKYKGKKDEASLRKQQAETQAVYQKYGASPTSGCLPLLISLPIMFALYQVIRNIPEYVNLVRDQYQIVADNIINSNLTGNIATIANVDASTITDSNKLISLLSFFKTTQWDEVLKIVTGNAVDAIKHIGNVNSFLGLSVTNTPDWKSAAILIPILATLLQFVQSKQLTVKNKNGEPNPTASAMSSMNYVMPIMSGFFALMLPIGVGIYWIANSAFSIIQQFFVNRYMDRMDMDELVEKSTAKANKKLSKTVATGGSLQELARKQTRTIDTNIPERTKATVKEEAPDTEEDSSDTKTKEPYKPSSISEIANLLKNRNEKGDK